MAFTDGRKIHVKNLSYEVEEDDLRDAFSKFGTILEVKVSGSAKTRDRQGTLVCRKISAQFSQESANLTWMLV